MSASCDYPQLRTAIALTIDQLLNSPAKATRIIRVYGLKYEQDGTEFEKDNRADKCRYTAAVSDFAIEFGGGGYHGEPHEECLLFAASDYRPRSKGKCQTYVNDPNHASPREYEGYQPRNIPDWVMRKGLDDRFQNLLGM